MIMELDNRLLKILEDKNFKTFVECFDFLSLAGYEESEAIMKAIDLFEGKPSDGIIHIGKEHVTSNGGGFTAVSGYTNHIVSSGSTTIGQIYDNSFRVEPYRNSPDDLLINVYVTTDKGDIKYKPLYKAFINTREYSPNESLDEQIKSIQIRLRTELGIKFFLDIMEELKK